MTVQNIRFHGILLNINDHAYLEASFDCSVPNPRSAVVGDNLLNDKRCVVRLDFRNFHFDAFAANSLAKPLNGQLG